MVAPFIKIMEIQRLILVGQYDGSNIPCIYVKYFDIGFKMLKIYIERF